MIWFWYVLWVLASYVLGSIPFGLLVATRLYKTDPREAGSRNTGATNVARLCGKKAGALALVLDVAKGAVPVAVALRLVESDLLLSLPGLAAILGHVFSVFLRLRGGKAVATTMGVFLVLAWWQLLVCLALFVLVVRASGFISLGSLTLVTAMPVMLLISWHPGLLPLALVVLVLVYWRHRENIVRLAKGEEKPWSKKKDQSREE